MLKSYQVYILVNASGRRYIGVSEDPEMRLRQHNAGESKWATKYRPWEIQWTSKHLPLSDARILENKLKRQKGGCGLNKILAIEEGS